MAKRVYIQTDTIKIAGTETVLISQNDYVDSPNLTYDFLSTEAIQQSKPIETIAKNHIIPIRLASPSARTCAERNKFAAQLDDFATFNWGGLDMFYEFGAFIINEKKGSLKLYNGPSFKNNYSKPQFQDGYTNLVGITFETQTISFTVGIYWISIEDYRVLMNALHPYEVNMLSFSFEKQYGYMCKLQTIKDSTRHIIGQESNTNSSSITSLNNSTLKGGNSGSRYRYYTELTLTFDVIGAQCAKELSAHYELFPNLVTTPEGTDQTQIDWTSTNINSFKSDLDYPFKVMFPLLAITDGKDSGTINITAQLTYTQGSQTIVTNQQSICTIGLKNITQSAPISLYYDSEHGLVYWSLGDKYQLIHLLSTQSNGQRILQSLDIKSFYWPGRFTLPQIESNQCNFSLIITLENITFNIQGPSTTENATTNTMMYVAQRRTNIL